MSLKVIMWSSVGVRVAQAIGLTGGAWLSGKRSEASQYNCNYSNNYLQETSPSLA